MEFDLDVGACNEAACVAHDAAFGIAGDAVAARKHAARIEVGKMLPKRFELRAPAGRPIRRSVSPTGSASVSPAAAGSSASCSAADAGASPAPTVAIAVANPAFTTKTLLF